MTGDVGIANGAQHLCGDIRSEAWNAKEIRHYIKNVWPLGDGDYKPASGSYLARKWFCIQ